jgi:hypothetical protein
MELRALEAIARGVETLADLERENPRLGGDLARFVKTVRDCCDEAYGNLSQKLQLVRNLPDNPSDPQLKHVQSDLYAAGDSAWFRDVARICDRLAVVADGFRSAIEDQGRYAEEHSNVAIEKVERKASWDLWSLIGTLDKHEGELKRDIRNAIANVQEELGRGNLDEARSRAKTIQEQIDFLNSQISQTANRITGTSTTGLRKLLTDTVGRSRKKQQAAPTVIHHHWGDEVHGDQFKDFTAASVGSHSTANNTEIQVWKSAVSELDLPRLAKALASLARKLRSADEGAEHDEEIGNVAAAEEAAKEGDGSKTLSHLKDAGRWVLDTARKTGSESAAKVIAAAMELPPKR